MYCPSCGKPASVDQKFCTLCGFGLQGLSELLTTQSSGSQFVQIPVEADDPLERRRRKLERLGILLFGVAALGVISAVIGGIVKVAIIEKGHVWSGLGIISVLLGIVIGAGLLGYSEYLKKSRAGRRSQTPAISPRASATTRLPHEPKVESVSSVTEHTTEFFKTSGEPSSGGEPASDR